MRQRSRTTTWLWRTAAGAAGLAALLSLAAWLYLRGSLARLDGTVAAAAVEASVTVARDERGVPLISGSNRLDLAYATGFVHAQERFFQMDLLRRTAAGELAELFGPRALLADRRHRLHRFRARAARTLAAMAPAERLFLDRYVAGINDGLGALAARPFEYALLGAVPRAWSAADSLLVVWAMFFELQGGLEARELGRGWLREHASADQLAFLLPESTAWDAPLDAPAPFAPAGAIPRAAPAWWGLGLPGAGEGGSAAIAAGGDADSLRDSVGSNNWALAGSRTRDGAAILSDDMHLGISLPNTWYRLAFRFPEAGAGTRRVVGVTLPGAPPLVVVGTNGQLAWGFTNSSGDYLDLVELGVDSARPGQLRTLAGWETPVRIEETILVKGAAPDLLVVRETSLGPVRETAGRHYAIRWAAHAADALNLNTMKLEAAATVDQALAIAATMGIPAQNFVAADERGNIGWTIGGLLPRRAHGSGAGSFEASFEASFPLAAGGAGAALHGRLPPGDYPRVVNPASGQLATANSRQLMGPGAAMIGDGGFDLGARTRQIGAGLAALGSRAELAGAYAITMDDRAIFLAPWRERAMRVLDARARAAQPQRAEFLRLLQASWSGRASVDSVGYRLTRAFMWALYELLFQRANAELARLDGKASVALATSRWPVVVARLLDEQPPGWLPAAWPDWRALQLAAIDKVIAAHTADGQQLADATWGRRNTAAIAHPISAAVPLLRRWLAAPPDMLAGDANMPRVAGVRFGQSQRMTVSPGREEQGVFNMPGGQSGHPLSPFFLRGHADWVAGTPTPLLPGEARHTLTFVPRPYLPGRAAQILCSISAIDSCGEGWPR